jgi:DNA polymerase V
LFEVKHKNESKEITQVIDALNNKYGKNKVKVATVGNREKEWALIKEHRSPRYTTQWNEILTIGKATP